MRYDLSLIGVPLGEVASRAKELHALGADGVFTAEGPNDVFFPLVLAASASDLAVMTNAAVAFPRNPIHLAHSAIDLQRLSGGRFRLGLAPQVRAHIEGRFGLEWSAPVERMADLVLALKAIFSSWTDGSPLDYQGTFYRHTKMTPMFTPERLSCGLPPIILGAQGPKMAQMCGRVADGLSILPFHSNASLHEVTLPAFAEGIAESNRRRSDLEVVAGAIVGVGTTDREVDEAKAGVRALLGFYGSTPAYAPALAAAGLEDRHPVLRAMVREGRWSELSSVVDDEMIEAFASVGTPTEVARSLSTRFGSIANRVSLFIAHQCDDDRIGALLAALSTQDRTATTMGP